MTDTFSFNTHTPEQTFEIGKQLAEQICTPVQIALKGTLGAGKTVFVQGLAAGLDIDDLITSPTYVLIKSYEGRLPLHHCDWYRLSSEGDIDSTGHEDLPAGVVAMEWADKFPEILEEPYIDIRINVVEGDEREVFIDVFGDDSLKIKMKEIHNKILQ